MHHHHHHHHHHHPPTPRSGPLAAAQADFNDEDPLKSSSTYSTRLNRRTVRKLDLLLLPFLALLFLLNSLDKSNIGNAETAGFTHDAGLSASDLNVSLAYFFAFFVALQPVGAALGRKYGMARWVPACMSLWGLCTILHIWVRRRWQLICLRIAIASLEAGFYPTTVSYLSLFYTRYEFAVRLGFFYGQSAVAGALGGVLSWAVFSHFPKQPSAPQLPPVDTVSAAVEGGWKSWEVLFLIEGCTTMCVALIGFFWLPKSADTAWFFTSQERLWAEQRIRLDRDNSDDNNALPANGGLEDEAVADEPHHRLLNDYADNTSRRRKFSTVSAISVTADSGLSTHDILSALLNYKIWHLLLCNILSAIPATAFGVFLPLVLKQLSPSLNLSPAASNLLSAPPFLFGAAILFLFTYWSDRTHQRLLPILVGLAILLVGLTLTVTTPRSNYILRYSALCILLSGSYIASPLTVAWISGNTPEPGKRAILLGINGWGNLAGVFSALLFRPEEEGSGYLGAFVVTLACVGASLAGFVAFWVMLVRENAWREGVVAGWSEDEREREELLGDAPAGEASSLGVWMEKLGLTVALERLGLERGRRGDEKITFRYGL
ncbi:hypothetical protein BAUCODRAFT_61850 [Baudoinia panamericana UAMH 10762]|uniref:Major facilitator superfamily (MFS) profile domain-containing protein n=1 Tax=Baudoinia panamericana (strain UAMH 10762) TaxID=717646 RepID=M2MU04_BAUPA|nr:uncharacterized protein BAUCODRAFT_61850 [Baudoinia panamericana UAMH 10762]EMD00407.1 hypothetical protein BAUCODRAFT_61850 [Baudoinia panamericana UAMH 10762]